LRQNGSGAIVHIVAAIGWTQLRELRNRRATSDSRVGWVGSTPGQFRALSIALVAIALLSLLVTALALEVRRSASTDIASDSASLIVSSEELYGRLADADATATRSFLAGGVEPAEIRQRYRDDLDAAASDLVDIENHAGTDPAVKSALSQISTLLPQYAGRVDAARANFAQGFPVGASYLRAASSSMQRDILPQATQIYRTASQRLDDRYGAAENPLHIVTIVIVAAVAIAGLVFTQWFVSRKTKRTLNPLLLVATLAAAVMAVWTLVVFTGEQDALSRAKADGSDPVEVLAVARILALRAESASSLAVTQRKAVDVAPLIGPLGGTDGRQGVVKQAVDVVPHLGSIGIVNDYSQFANAMTSVQMQVANGDYQAAAQSALGDQTSWARLLDDGLETRITTARQSFTSDAAEAEDGFTALGAVIVFGSLVLIACVLVGLQLRIREYR
jgi:hypothetical protein